MINTILEEWNEKIINKKKKIVNEIVNKITIKEKIKINDQFWIKLKKINNKKITDSLIKIISMYINQNLKFEIKRNDLINLILDKIMNKQFNLDELVLNNSIKEFENIYNKLLKFNLQDQDIMNFENKNIKNNEIDNIENKNNYNEIDKIFNNNSKMLDTTLNSLKKTNKKKEKLYYLDSNSISKKSFNNIKKEIKSNKKTKYNINNISLNKIGFIEPINKNDLVFTPKININSKKSPSNNKNKKKFKKGSIFTKIMTKKLNNNKTIIKEIQPKTHKIKLKKSKKSSCSKSKSRIKLKKNKSIKLLI